MIHKWFTGDSENDLKINIVLAAVESAVDVVFKDPALIWQLHIALLWYMDSVIKSSLIGGGGDPLTTAYYHKVNIN